MIFLCDSDAGFRQTALNEAMIRRAENQGKWAINETGDIKSDGCMRGTRHTQILSGYASLLAAFLTVLLSAKTCSKSRTLLIL